MSPDNLTLVREDLESVPFVPEGGTAEEVVEDAASENLEVPSEEATA